MAESTNKTKDYILRAKNNYRNKHDTLSVLLPKGTKDLIKENVGMSINAYIVDLIKKDLKKNYNVDIDE